MYVCAGLDCLYHFATIGPAALLYSLWSIFEHSLPLKVFMEKTQRTNTHTYTHESNATQTSYKHTRTHTRNRSQHAQQHTLDITHTHIHPCGNFVVCSFPINKPLEDAKDLCVCVRVCVRSYQTQNFFVSIFLHRLVCILSLSLAGCENNWEHREWILCVYMSAGLQPYLGLKS